MGYSAGKIQPENSAGGIMTKPQWVPLRRPPARQLRSPADLKDQLSQDAIEARAGLPMFSVPAAATEQRIRLST